MYRDKSRRCPATFFPCSELSRYKSCMSQVSRSKWGTRYKCCATQCSETLLLGVCTRLQGNFFLDYPVNYRSPIALICSKKNFQNNSFSLSRIWWRRTMSKLSSMLVGGEKECVKLCTRLLISRHLRWSHLSLAIANETRKRVNHARQYSILASSLRHIIRTVWRLVDP